MRDMIVGMLVGSALAALAGAGAGAAAATSDPGLAIDVTETVEKTETPEESREQAERLSSEYGVPADQIDLLHRQGMGWGEVRIALAVARMSGQPLGEVAKLRQFGLGWGEITRRYGFKLGEVLGVDLRDKLADEAGIERWRRDLAADMLDLKDDGPAIREDRRALRDGYKTYVLSVRATGADSPAARAAESRLRDIRDTLRRKTGALRREPGGFFQDRRELRRGMPGVHRETR